MTEPLQPLSTQIAIPSQKLSPNTISAAANDVPHKVETVEEEPYTIKCICSFSGDDGNTIYCDTCDTWQHIDCFYPNNREEALGEGFLHSCADCNPRPLDKAKAVERTQRLKNATPVTAIDKKAKRPPAKNQKKKPKPSDLQLNGNHSGHDNSKHASPNDQPHPSKKAKTSHKPSHSTSSQAGKRSPTYGARAHPHGHPPSPATTPPDLPLGLEIHNYSDGFRKLYSDKDAQSVQSNTFASLDVSNTMSLWLREPDKLKADVGEKFDDVFQTMSAEMESRKRPIHVDHKKVPLNADLVLWCRYLTTPTSVEKDAPLIEMNGLIGFQTDYCRNQANMWESLNIPLPFVFFHPALPLYIDTRKEGSQARYVRRSCKPNASLETFISDGSEYHFWIVSERPIAPNEQITLQWDFRFPKGNSARYIHLIGLGDDETNGFDEPDMSEIEYQNLSGWIYRVLSEHGGCACDLGNNCAFARFHRRYYSKSQSRAANGKKRSRKQNKTHTISPTSTGQATNSRAPSEGHPDDGQDSKSASGSSHSKPPSRDLTPAPRQGSFDTLGILTEPTDRDKRKVAMVEDTFRRMEQQQLPPRKKPKRTSDGTGSSKPKSAKGNMPERVVANGIVHYVDSYTSRSKSGSPTSAISPGAAIPLKQPASREGSVDPASRQGSIAPRANYCDAAVQTDAVEGEWFSEPRQSPTCRRRIISLSQRLLNSRHRQRVGDDRRRSGGSQDGATGTAMDVDPPIPEPNASPIAPATGDNQALLVSPVQATPGDVPMMDAPSISPTTVKPPPINLVAPVISASTSPVKTKSPDLRVTMPPIPAFPPTISTASAVTTPLSATGSMVQSPYSACTVPTSPFLPSVNGIAQSPIRKKLSLSDYRKSKQDKSAAGKTTHGARPSLSTNSTAGLDSIVDSPTAEKGSDGIPANPQPPATTDSL